MSEGGTVRRRKYSTPVASYPQPRSINQQHWASRVCRRALTVGIKYVSARRPKEWPIASWMYPILTVASWYRRLRAVAESSINDHGCPAAIRNHCILILPGPASCKLIAWTAMKPLTIIPTWNRKCSEIANLLLTYLLTSSVRLCKIPFSDAKPSLKTAAGCHVQFCFCH